MVTCNGLIVGIITDALRNSLAKQCGEFLKTHKYLLDTNPVFEVENIKYLQLQDYNIDKNALFCRFIFVDNDIVYVRV